MRFLHRLYTRYAFRRSFKAYFDAIEAANKRRNTRALHHSRKALSEAVHAALAGRG